MPLQLLSFSAAGNTAQHEVVVLTQQLDDLQSALEAAEMDRQALAAQRDGWMASFQVWCSDVKTRQTLQAACRHVQRI
jgi:hypothetical protein